MILKNHTAHAWLLAGFFLFSNTGLALADTESETQCFDNVRGKIPWNKENNMNWKPENVQQLCRGTSMPMEPGACYLSVLKENVNWGKGVDWEWQNIINLCSGTNSGEKTVSCFKNAIKTGTDWRDATLACQRVN